jgi:anthranilate synthase component II
MKNARLLVIDNFDSFTFNLVQMFGHYDLEVCIYRNDAIDCKQIAALNPDYILISPGPKDPAHAGISIPLIKAFYQHIPILGVCLGMQCINESFGGMTIPAPLPVHGKTSLVTHHGTGIFSGMPNRFVAARYHSLAVQLNGDDLEVTAQSDDGVIMGLSHRCFPLHGVQFHPESFLTEHGFKLIENFLRLGPLKTAHSGFVHAGLHTPPQREKAMAA